MGLFLRLKSNKSTATGVQLAGSGVTAYAFQSDGATVGVFGSPSFERLYARPVDGAPSKLGDREELRQFTLPILVTGASHSAFTSAMGTLLSEIEDCNTYGGRLRWRPTDATYCVEFDIKSVDVGDVFSSHADFADRQVVDLMFTVAAYALADPMYVADDFDVDTFGTAGIYNNGGADWTADAGALANMPVTSGALDASLNLTTENRYIHTGSAHSYTDGGAEITFSPGALTTGTKEGVVVKRVDASNYVEAYMSYTSAPAVPTYVGAGTIITATTAATTLTAAQLNSANVLAGDLMIVVLESGGGDSFASFAGGSEDWRTITGVTQGGTQLSILYAYASQDVPIPPTIGAAADHIIGYCMVFRGAALIDPSVTSTDAVSDTSASITGTTTTINNSLILYVTTGDLPDASSVVEYSGWTDASLTSVTERLDAAETVGNGGAIGAATGILATAGTTGAMTATKANAAVKAQICIPLAPASTNVVVRSVLAGTPTTLATIPYVPRMAVGAAYQLRCTMRGNTVIPRLDPFSPVVGFATGATVPLALVHLTGATATALGKGVAGRCGIVCTPQHTDTWVGGFRARAFWDLRASSNYSTGFAEPWYGAIPGSAPALVDYYTNQNGSAKWLHLSMWPKRRTFNMIPTAKVGTTDCWSVAAVTGIVTNAATSNTTNYTDVADSGGTLVRRRIVGQMDVVTPASTDSGTSVFIPHTFHKGITYTASCYVIAPTGTNQIRVKLGVATDLATGTSTACSTSWQLLSVTWTPTFTTYGAYFAVTTASASGQDWTQGEPLVYEGTTAPDLELREGAFPVPGTIGLCGSSEIGSAFTNTADTSSVFGITPQGTGNLGSNGTLTFTIKPNAGSECDQLGFAYFDTWLLLLTDSTRTSCTVTLDITSIDSTATRQYSAPFGTTGKSLTAFSASNGRRWYYMGRVALRVRDTPTMRGRLVFTSTAGSTITPDVIHFAPAARQAMVPSGVAGDLLPSSYLHIGNDLSLNYPYFDEYVGDSAVSSSMGAVVGPSRLTLPHGQAFESMRVSALRVPDDTTSDSTGVSAKMSKPVQFFAIQPRYYIASGA